MWNYYMFIIDFNFQRSKGGHEAYYLRQLKSLFDEVKCRAYKNLVLTDTCSVAAFQTVNVPLRKL